MNLHTPMMIRGSILTAALAVALTSCQSTRQADLQDDQRPVAPTTFQSVSLPRKPAPELLRPGSEAYRVGAGDLLDIEIVETPDTQAEVPVLPDGMLYFNIADGVQAAGKTIPQIEAALADQLKSEYPFPVVSINVVEANSQAYTILGQVMEPGSYPVNGPVTLLDAIAGAKGLSSTESGAISQELADLGRSVILRDGHALPVDFRSLIEEGDMAHNVAVMPGDFIILPSSGQAKVYVLGAVNQPRPLPYSSRATVLSALADAKGLKPKAFSTGILVIRGSFRDPQIAHVSLNKIVRGAQQNIPLEPGDIVWVPRHPWRKLGEYAMIALETAATSLALQESTDLFGDDDDDDFLGTDDTPEVFQNIGPQPSPTIDTATPTGTTTTPETGLIVGPQVTFQP